MTPATFVSAVLAVLVLGGYGILLAGLGQALGGFRELVLNSRNLVPAETRRVDTYPALRIIAVCLGILGACCAISGVLLAVTLVVHGTPYP